MYKLILLLFFAIISVHTSYWSMNLWSSFWHEYTITNTDSCSWYITKITKSWSTQTTWAPFLRRVYDRSPAQASVHNYLNMDSWTYSYNVNNFLLNAWQSITTWLNFETKSFGLWVVWWEVFSNVSYDYTLGSDCIQNWDFENTAWVTSSLIWSWWWWGWSQNWICWSSNGWVFTSTPSSNLCSLWTVSNMTSTTTWWSWQCNWTGWWMFDSCSASRDSSWWWDPTWPWTWSTPINWSCWSANNTRSLNTPTSWLCASWSASWVSRSWNNWVWSCSWISWWGDSSCSAPTYYCGDWYLNRPNTDWVNEQCDFWSNPWSSWCSSSCQITDFGGFVWDPGIVFSPNWNEIIWHNQQLSNRFTNPSIRNNTLSNLYIPRKLCLQKTDVNNVLVWDVNKCSTWNIWWLNIWNAFSFTRPIYTWNIIWKPISFWQAILNTSLEWFHWVTWSANYNVRVAKPSITTFWWWASRINPWYNLSDINVLATDFWWLINPSFNNNFILTSLWDSPLSSFTKKVDNTQSSFSWSINEWQRDISNFWWNLVSVSHSFWLNINSLSDIVNQFSNFRWHLNVFEYSWDVNINSNINITWNKTFIIEDWDLNINWDITSNDWLLFVVRNWDVVINNNVSKIEAVIINIWWEIKWSWISTQNRLVVNWALYWNVSNLLQERTYIADRWAYIDVWTNINFTSRIFSNPAPLLSRFMWEYMEVEKIAR